MVLEIETELEYSVPIGVEAGFDCPVSSDAVVLEDPLLRSGG